MDRPAPEDRQYLQRVTAAIPRLEDSRAPESLAETLDRMEDMERRLRGLGRADARGPDHGISTLPSWRDCEPLTLRTTLGEIDPLLDGLSIRWALAGGLSANRYRRSP